MVISRLQASNTGQIAKLGQLIYRFQCSILKLYIGICNLLKLFFAVSSLPITSGGMELIYHGCITKNADGTNKIIGLGEKCLTLSAQCFWKDPRDIKSSGVKHAVRQQDNLL